MKDERGFAALARYADRERKLARYERARRARTGLRADERRVLDAARAEIARELNEGWLLATLVADVGRTARRFIEG